MPAVQRKPILEPTVPAELDIEDAIAAVKALASMCDWAANRLRYGGVLAFRPRPPFHLPERRYAPIFSEPLIGPNTRSPRKPVIIGSEHPNRTLNSAGDANTRDNDANEHEARRDNQLAGRKQNRAETEDTKAANDTERLKALAYREVEKLYAAGKDILEVCDALRADHLEIAAYLRDAGGGSEMVGLSRLWNAVNLAGHRANGASAKQSTKKTQKPRPAAEPAAADPEPWPEPVDLAELLDGLVAIFKDYLSLPEGAAEALTLWVVFTHAIEATAIAPRLAILSPTHRCGKSTLILLLIRLVRRPLPSSNATSASVFRAITELGAPTLLFDEADTFFNGNSELIGILNSGHTRDTAYVLRAAKVKDDYEPTTFGTYAAIAIAKIGKLPGPLHDRAIVIHMQRPRSDEKLKRFRADRVEDLLQLRQKAVRWVADHLSELEGADPELPEVLNDRAQDNWRTMVAIADAAGGHWPETARRVAVVISGDETDATPRSVQLLQDIKEIFTQRGFDRFSLAELCQALGRLEERPWNTIEDGSTISPRRLSSMLKDYRIRPKAMRAPGTKPFKGYMRDQFEDVWSRYASDSRDDLQNDVGSDLAAAPDAMGSANGGDANGYCNADLSISHGSGKPNQINDVTGLEECYQSRYRDLGSNLLKSNDVTDVTDVTGDSVSQAHPPLLTRKFPPFKPTGYQEDEDE